MKTLGVSAKDVQRAEALLEEERMLVRRRRNKILKALAGLAALGGLGAFVWASLTEPEPPPTLEQAQNAEKALYEALDEKDPARIEEARENLTSPEERVRLAAVRYLAAVDPDERLLDLFDDESQRVRRVAIQVVSAELPGKAADHALLAAAASRDRPLEERMLALSGLRDRETDEPRALARKLLPLLRDDQAALRAQVPAVLEHLTGQAVSVEAQKPEDLYAAWARALQEAP